MKKIYQTLGRHMSRARIQQISLVSVGIMAIGTVAFFGTHQKQASQAATPGTMYLMTSARPIEPGATLSVAIRADSGSDALNAVQAGLVYNTSQLQFQSITESTAFPFAAATDTTTPGEIRIARGVNSGAPGVTGDNVIVSVNFKVLAANGTTTSLSFNNAFSLMVRSGDNTNVMKTSIGASYDIQYYPPYITGVSPGSGPLTGGTQITITGGNFKPGATFKIGGTPATNVVFVSSSTLTAVVPPATIPGTVGVQVINPDGQSAIGNGPTNVPFTYIAAKPTISGVSPNSGPITGGTTVTINGTNFVSGASVHIGTLAATGVTFVSPTSLRVVVPAQAAGVKDVTVYNPDQQSAVMTAAFSYTSTLPTVTAVSPNYGYIGGGQRVTITGTNFAPGSTVAFDLIAATNVLVVNSTTITATAPAHPAGSSAVSVTSNGQVNGLKLVYTYRLAGDANGDGRINAIDYGLLVDHDGENYPDADFNTDGTVGAADLAMLLAAWTW